MSICACGQPLWYPDSIEAGSCGHCRLYGPAPPGSRMLPYRLPPGYKPPDERDPGEPEIRGPGKKRERPPVHLPPRIYTPPRQPGVGPGRCTDCGWYGVLQGHHPDCQNQ